MTMLDTCRDLDDLDALDEPDLFALYGTLRSGCRNDRLWRGRADSLGTDTVRPFRLTTNGGFPYAVPADDIGQRIVVELIQPHESERHSLMEDMDHLEGCPRHYVRIVVITDEARAAWLYVPSAATMEHAARKTPIPSGDWLDYVNERANW